MTAAQRLGADLSASVRQPLSVEVEPYSVTTLVIVTTATLADALAGCMAAPHIAQALHETLGGHWRVGLIPQPHRCYASLALLRPEIQRVRETPEAVYYREEPEIELHKFESAPHTPYCTLNLPHEVHAATVAHFTSSNLDIWITWRTGVHGSREIGQPGCCDLLDDPDANQMCLAPAGHDGECWPNEVLLAVPANATCSPART